MKGEKLEITVYKSISQKLIEEWKSLWEKSSSACIFNSPGWFASAQAAFQYKEMRIIILRDKKSKKLEGVIPLVSSYKYGLRTYVLPGHEFINHYFFLVNLKNKEDRNNLMRKILTIGTIYISGLARKDAEYFLSEKNTRMFLNDKNPYIKFNHEYNEYFREKTFKKLSCRVNKIKKDFGSYEFEFQFPIKTDMIDKLILLDQKSSRAAKGKSIFDKKENRIFFRSLYGENANNIFAGLMYFNKECVAYNTGFVCRGIYTGSQKAHLPKYNKYSPGVLIFEKILEEISRNNPQEFDLGGGIDQFKMKYAKNVKDIYGIVFAKSSFKGYYFRFMHELRRRLYDVLINRPAVYRYYKKVANFSLSKRSFLKARSES